MSLLLVSAQNFGGFARFNSLTGDFGGPTAFSGSSFPSAALTNGVRDPRENRGNEQGAHFHYHPLFMLNHENC